MGTQELADAYPIKAHHYHDRADSRTWLRVILSNGFEYDEPISGWELINDLTRGKSFYRNKYSGQEIDADY